MPSEAKYRAIRIEDKLDEIRRVLEDILIELRKGRQITDVVSRQSLSDNQVTVNPPYYDSDMPPQRRTKP